MSNELILTRVAMPKLQEMFDANYDEFLEFLEDQPQVWIEDVDTFMSISEDHDTLSEFRYIGPRGIESKFFYGHYLDDEMVAYLADLFEDKQFSADDEFFDDFEEYIEPMNQFRDMLMAAKQNKEVVLLHPDLRDT